MKKCTSMNLGTISLLFFALFALGCGNKPESLFNTIFNVNKDFDVTQSFMVLFETDKIYEQAGINPSIFPNGKLPKQFKKELSFFFTKKFDMSSDPRFKGKLHKIHAIKLKKAMFELTDNTLNIDFPKKGTQLSIASGPFKSNNPQHFRQFGSIPFIPKGTQELYQEIPLIKKSLPQLEAYLKTGQLNIRIVGKTVLDGSVSQVIPRGHIELRIDIDATITVRLTLDDAANTSVPKTRNVPKTEKPQRKPHAL